MADQPEVLLFCSNSAHLVGGKFKGIFFFPRAFSLCALQSWLMKLTVYIVLYSLFSVHFAVQLPALLLSVTSSLTKNISTVSHFCVCILIFYAFIFMKFYFCQIYIFYAFAHKIRTIIYIK